VVPDGFAVQELAQELQAPVALQFMPDGRLLFAEQFSGRVRVFFEGAGVQSQPVLQLMDVAIDGGERGLLGIALDPAFPERPYLYVHYTAASPNRIRIARFTLTGDLIGNFEQPLLADPTSRYELIDDIRDQAQNHNGGTVRFAVDGRLYVSLGEDAQPCAAQDTTALQGKILRLQVHTLPEGPGRAFRAQITPFDNPFVSRPDSNARLVAALGLRNPFRIQPDRVRNWLVIGDAGANAREELDVLVLHLPTPRPAQPELGADYGWPFLEGSVPGPGGCGPVLPNLAAPEFEYDRTSQLGGAAIIAAGAYWATGTGAYDWPTDYAGDLFANDYYSGTLYHLVPSGNGFAPGPDVPGQPAPGKWGTGFNEIADWALGRDGAFYFCRQSIDFAPGTGVIGRIISTAPRPEPPPALALLLFNSPAVNGALFLVTIPSRPAVLTIHDTSGRRVRRFTDDQFQPRSSGYLGVPWDGTDDDGRKVHPGMYVARLESAGRDKSVRVPFLR
jgi:glucose/arabinose dehydrogenase